MKHGRKQEIKAFITSCLVNPQAREPLRGVGASCLQPSFCRSHSSSDAKHVRPQHKIWEHLATRCNDRCPRRIGAKILRVSFLLVSFQLWCSVRIACRYVWIAVSGGLQDRCAHNDGFRISMLAVGNVSKFLGATFDSTNEMAKQMMLMKEECSSLHVCCLWCGEMTKVQQRPTLRRPEL